MQKNEVYTAVASGTGTEGEAIFRVGDTPVFVPFCIEGEEAEIQILSVKGGVAYGKCLRVTKPAQSRVEPRCPLFAKCGGCQLQHMRYDAQLELKRSLVAATLKKIGGMETDVLPTHPSAMQYGYRNKLVLPVGTDAQGNTVVGFYAPRSHRIVPAEDCPIQSPWCADVIAVVKAYMRANCLKGYDELTRKGDIRRVAVREVGGRYIVALVAAHNVNAAPFADMLKERLGECAVLLNINKSQGNAIFGDDWRTVRGEGFFEAEDMGIKFRAGANTFLQVNEGVRNDLYRQIVAEAADGGAVAIDLYSGGGMLTAMLARACKAAYGVEVVKEASICADELKNLNSLSGRMFNICGKVEEQLSHVFQLTASERRVIVCDPPRKGMERSAVEAVRESGADKVILVSCNPATLARDLGILLGSLKEEDGALKKNPDYAATSAYSIEYIRPYDMFPQTKWCETLVLLSKKPDSHINVTVEFGEGEGQISLKEVEKRAEARKPKEKVTYKMIQQYIEEHYGFMVHTAYIAEVKRSLGLPMYDAPNAVEELKRPRSHPTEKMVLAIKETLAHFEII